MLRVGLGALGVVALGVISSKLSGNYLHAASSPAEPQLAPMKHGLPVGAENIRAHGGYVLSYNNKHKQANWVCEHITKASVAAKVGSRDDVPFKEDPTILQQFRSTLDDYKRSGFDRGHMAPAANHRYTQNATEETFFLSNMSPQVGKGFNRDSWARLENYVRDLTNTYAHVFVCTGPLYIAAKEADGKSYVKYQVIGASQVAVPTHYFKVIAGEKPSGEIEIQVRSCIDNNTAITDVTYRDRMYGF